MIARARRGETPEPGEGDEYELLPAGDPVYNLDDVKERAIVDWRVRCFERLGFGATAAAALALRRDVDRVRVESLVARGASLSQVVGILL